MHDDDFAAPASERFHRTGTVTWCRETAYATGLIATDGYMTNRSRIGFGSCDRALVETFLHCIGRPVQYSTTPPGRVRSLNGREVTTKREFFVALCYDPLLWHFFAAAGITANKSLTIGALRVPHENLPDTIRGLLDGDGSVMASVRAPNGTAHPYRRLRLRVIFYSGSRLHLDWIREVLSGWTIRCSISEDTRKGHESFRLELSDRQAVVLLTTLYEDPRAPRLERKWRVWQRYRSLMSLPDHVAFL